MFIFNFKVNGSKSFKIVFSIILIILFIIIGIIVFKIFTGSKSSYGNSRCTPAGKVYEISPKNYTNVLKTVHDNIDSYVGTKINFTGYVYRIYDFADNQFVLARDMIVSSGNQTVVVGFLCESNEIKKVSDYSWVELTGTIKKGNYHGDMPIVQVTRINEVQRPNNEYVYPPDESYIPTTGLL